MLTSLSARARGSQSSKELVKPYQRVKRKYFVACNEYSDEFYTVGNDISLAKVRKRKELWPSFDFTKEQAIEAQLQALKINNTPYSDHGVEVLYRFADFDPFERSKYFGRSLDLGQFERFRRIMHHHCYATLLNYTKAEMLSGMQISERHWKQRIAVTDLTGREERTYEILMAQRLGGIYDGYWFTHSLICDDPEWLTEIKRIPM